MKTDKKAISVAMVSAHYPVGRKELVGGVESACYYLSHGLNKLPEVKVTVFVPRADRYGLSKPTQMEDDGVTVVGIPSPAARGWLLNHLMLDPGTLVRSARGHFDLFHVQNEALWAARAPSPRVLTIHGINERDVLFRGATAVRHLRSWVNYVFQNAMRRQVVDIIATSPYVHQVFKPKRRQRVWDIDNPIADSYFEIRREPIAGRILFAGTICRRKNVMGLIEAFAIACQEAPCELRLAGAEVEKDYAIRCREFAHKLGLAGRVKFLGSLTIQQMQQELAQAAVLALCSFQETAPLIIGEAMAAGVPVLASNICGVPWLVTEGTTGRLVRPQEPCDIVRGLKLLLTQDDLEKMGQEARKVAQKRFVASVVAEKTVGVYRSMLGSPYHNTSNPSSLRHAQRLCR